MSKWDIKDKYTQSTKHTKTEEPQLTEAQERLIQVYENVVRKLEAAGDIIDQWQEQNLLGNIATVLTDINAAIELVVPNKFPSYDANTFASIRDSLLIAEENLVSAANNIQSWLDNEEAAKILEKRWGLAEGTLYGEDIDEVDDAEQ